jgi:hypothetical protein
MGALTGKGRLWGSGDLRHWAALDLGRWRKETAVILDLGRHASPTITPDDPDRVLAILRERVPHLGGPSGFGRVRRLVASLRFGLERLLLPGRRLRLHHGWPPHP